MSTNEIRDTNATAARVDLKLKVVVIPVSDVDRAKEFYGSSGGGSTPTTITAVTSA